jgi:hypothetical protein
MRMSPEMTDTKFILPLRRQNSARLFHKNHFVYSLKQEEKPPVFRIAV